MVNERNMNEKREETSKEFGAENAWRTEMNCTIETVNEVSHEKSRRRAQTGRDGTATMVNT